LAVAYRENHSKGSIQISVFKNRVEILNPGNLPEELSLADLQFPHGSYPYNPLLTGLKLNLRFSVNVTKTNEQVLEATIEKALTGTPVSARY
jgi:predicted HTH transcriptional regulator